MNSIRRGRGKNNSDIIQFDDLGSPVLNFALQGCTYCDECALSCSSDVLDIKFKKNINVKFSIDTALCLSWKKTMCFSCKDPCIDNAIDFQGLFSPTIDLTKCTSCGFCVSVCPTDAIKLEII